VEWTIVEKHVEPAVLLDLDPRGKGLQPADARPLSHSMKSRSPGRIGTSPGALPYQSAECLAPVSLRDRPEVRATYDTATVGERTGALPPCRRRDALVTSMTTMKPT